MIELFHKLSNPIKLELLKHNWTMKSGIEC